MSEIILQQTRVEQGRQYYLHFIKRFPDIRSLALAKEDDVLAIWKGLGYYSRALNMHLAAQNIVSEFNGIIPNFKEGLIRQKGIGEYTARAILSFAFGQAEAVVDGNVYRVLSRVFGIKTSIDSGEGKKKFQALADLLVNRQAPAVHNQKMLDLGATVCTPKSPSCQKCVLAEDCVAFKTDQVYSFPVRAKRKKKKTRFFNYFLIIQEGKTMMVKRGKNGIWKGLYEPPLFESQEVFKDSQFPEIKKKMQNPVLREIEKVEFLKEDHQILTHQKIICRFYKATINSAVKGQFFANEQISELAMPVVVDRFFKNR